MCRVNSLLGICGLLRTLYQTDEAYAELLKLEDRVKEVRESLTDLCPYDTPFRSEGIF